MEARLITGAAKALEKIQTVTKSLELQAELRKAARDLEAAVKEALSQPPGTGDHSAPWLQTGSLRDSISHRTTDREAVIGSSDAVAVFQELGTRAIPPRPFLAPVAASLAPHLVEEISEHLAILSGDRS